MAKNIWISILSIICTAVFIIYPVEASAPTAPVGEDTIKNIPIDLESVRLVRCGDRSGTGTIIEKDVVLTAAHVVKNSVLCADVEEEKLGVVIYSNPEEDIAILKFSEGVLPNKIVPVTCDDYRNDQIYIAIGWARGQTLKTNILFPTGFRIIYLPVYDPPYLIFYKRLVYLRGELIQGMSGGPIINLKGEIVGTNQMTDFSKFTNTGSKAFSRSIKDTFMCPQNND